MWNIRAGPVACQTNYSVVGLYIPLYPYTILIFSFWFTVFCFFFCRRIFRTTTRRMTAMRSWLLLMAWCAFAAVGQRPTPNKRHDVYIAGFFPFGGRVSGSIPEGRVGRGVMPAVKLAVDHINENPTLLRNYRLHVWWNDTQVSTAVDLNFYSHRNIYILKQGNVLKCYRNSNMI